MSRITATMVSLFLLCVAVPFAICQDVEPAPTLDTVEEQVTRIFETSRDALVRIHARSDTGKIRRRPDLPAYRIGTGFIIDKMGWVATTASNVDDADQIEIEWKGRRYPTIVLGVDLYTNFALLRIDARNSDTVFPELMLGDSDALKIGSISIALGFPYELDVTPAWGVVGGIETSRGKNVFQVAHIRSSVKVSPGQGGGPLLNSKGEVVGIIIAATDLDDATYSLPAAAIKKLRDDFINDGKARYGWTGLSAVDKPVTLAPDREAERRPVITAIAAGSPAARSDLRLGDVLLEIEGVSIASSAEIPSLLFYKRDGESLRLQIMRGQETLMVTLPLAARPPSFIPVQKRQPPTSPTTPPMPSAPKTLPASANEPR